MTQLIATNGPYQIEEQNGHFKFLTQSGWPIGSFAIEHIPHMLTLLQIAQQELETPKEVYDGIHRGLDLIETLILEKITALNSLPPMEGTVPGFKITWAELCADMNRELENQLKQYRNRRQTPTESPKRYPNVPPAERE